MAIAAAIALLALLPAIQTATAQTADEASLDLVSATRYIVIDSATGEVFAEQDSDIRGGMASLTKIFTALVAIERASSLQQRIVATDADLFDATSTRMTGFNAGVSFTVEDLLYGMILESGNDAAMALARGIAEQPGDTPQQSVDRFVGWMNERVAELGLENTRFVNPHGLSDPDHYSTPRELAAFTMFAMQNPTFAQVITTRTYTTSTGVSITSVNRGPEFMQSYIGGKTGFDESTGYCLIEIAERDDATLISVTIDGIAPDVWYQDHAILLEYGFNALADRLSAGLPIGNDVVALQLDETEADPAADEDENEPAKSDIVVLEGDDNVIAPVRIQGTPGAGTAGESDDEGGGMLDNWFGAAVLAVVVFGAIVLRTSRSHRNPGAPVAPEV
ncbi:MAG: serine hydrolase [Chloroflexota bacterium]|nr:serine hydrolase [Chloroflexota bacterium]